MPLKSFKTQTFKVLWQRTEHKLTALVPYPLVGNSNEICITRITPYTAKTHFVSLPMQKQTNNNNKTPESVVGEFGGIMLLERIAPFLPYSYGGRSGPQNHLLNQKM